MRTITKTIWLLTIFCFTLSGCTINEVVTAEETQLVVAEVPPDESMLLDIGVVEFNAGMKESNDPQQLRWITMHLQL